MTEENCHIPLNPIYQNVPQERRLINHNSFDSFEEAEDDRLYESIGSLPQENQLQNCNEDNNQENNYNRFHVSPFMIPLLIVEICLSFVDFTSDFLNGYSLFKSEDNRSSWGVGSLVVNWIPGVLAVIQIIANHRCDKIHKIIPCSLAILILCPFIPTFSFLFLLYKAPRNSEEDQSREFVRNYTKLLSFVTLVRALEGCIESPLQILYKFSMMFNGVIEFNLANVEVSFHDLQGNTIPVPFFINFLVSSACLLKSVYGLNMQCFKTGTSDNSFAKLEMLDFVAFLVTTTLFKLASTILLVGYFSLFSALPFVVTLFFGIYINSSTIRDERKIPNWLIVFMNLFVPICFTTDDSKDISCVQEKNLKLQTWNCAIVYGFSLIILGLLVNFSMYHMDPDIPISYMMFKTFIVSTLVLGILAMIFSIRMKILEEMSKKKKFFLAMIKIIRILTLSSAFVLFGIFVSMFPLKNPTLKVKFSDESIFEGRVIVPLREKILNISMKDVRIIHGEDFEKEFEGIVLNSHPKLLIVLNNKEEQPSSPAPFVNDLGVPTLLIKKEDRSKFSKISNSSESFQIYSSLEKEGRPQFKDDSRLKKSSDESESIGSKVIYFTGADSRSVQVIDMKSPNVSCDGFKELPVHVNGAVGGRIGSNYIYCGGMVFSEKGDTSSIKMCYIIGNEKPFMDMREARFAASAVVLPKNNTLFITGGRDIKNDKNHLSTELVSIKPPTTIAGPNLPKSFRDHCSVLVGDYAILIGGRETMKKVLAINIKTGVMTYMPDLNYGRFSHACGTYVGENGNVILVAGGKHRNLDGIITSQKTTEILNFESLESKFRIGPTFEHDCSGGSMVTAVNGEWIRLLGCYPNNTNKIYALHNGKKWKLYPKILKYPNHQGIALNVPDDQVTCF